jgi:hypothetical protein
MGTPAMSETWDIELQSKYPSSDGFSAQPDQHVAGSLILDPRKASWHDQELPPKGPVIHSVLTTTPVKKTLRGPTEGIVSPASASAIATIYDLDYDSSVHPSHSASQIGLKRLDHPKFPQELLTSQYLVVRANPNVQQHVPPMLDQPQQVECQDMVQHYADDSSGVMSNCNPRDAYTHSVSLPRYINTMHRAAALNVTDDSSPLRVHGISQEQFLPVADNAIPDYRSFSVIQSSCPTMHDVVIRYPPDEFPVEDMNSICRNVQEYDTVFLTPPDLVNSPSFHSPMEFYSSDGPRDLSDDDVVVPDEGSEGVTQPFEYIQDLGDCEHSDVIHGSYQGSFASVSPSYTTAEAYDDTSCSLRPFLQGRAMLLGIPPYVPLQNTEQVNLGHNLLSAEVGVAKRLKDHWRPHRL